MARKKIDGSGEQVPSTVGSDTELDGHKVDGTASEDIRASENKAGGEESVIIEPGSIEEGGESSAFEFKPRKRGRKPKADKEAASDLNALLWMIHKGIATATGIEQMELAPEESKDLADAIARVQAFYPTSVLAPIAMAWIGLVVTAGRVYVPRVIAYKNEKKKKRGPRVVAEVPLPPGTGINTEVM